MYINVNGGTSTAIYIKKNPTYEQAMKGEVKGKKSEHTDIQFHYFDMHTHILPGVDDGAKDEAESLQMAELAYREGIRYICATPHYNVKKAASREDCIKIYRQLRQKIRQLHPEMELYLGNEILYSYDVIEHLRSGRASSYNSSRYVLIEFFPSETYRHVYEAVQAVYRAGFSPVIAHIERVKCLWKDWPKLDELKNCAAVLQMNTGSLTGSPLDGHVRYCRKLVQEGYIDILGSDMHGVDHRPPVYREAAEWIKQQCGTDILRRLAFENPITILKNQQIY